MPCGNNPAWIYHTVRSAGARMITSTHAPELYILGSVLLVAFMLACILVYACRRRMRHG